MAITAAAASFSGTGPSATGQVLAFGGNDLGTAFAYKGTATVTGDGSSTSFVINLIDGTKTIPFTPKGVICTRCGGAATATIGIVSAVADNKIITVTTTAAVNAATFTVAFLLIP